MLEERPGVQLIQRFTRHFIVTEVVRNYYERCKAILVASPALVARLGLSLPQGTFMLDAVRFGL